MLSGATTARRELATEHILRLSENWHLSVFALLCVRGSADMAAPARRSVRMAFICAAWFWGWTGLPRHLPHAVLPPSSSPEGVVFSTLTGRRKLMSRTRTFGEWRRACASTARGGRWSFGYFALFCTWLFRLGRLKFKVTLSRFSSRSNQSQEKSPYLRGTFVANRIQGRKPAGAFPMPRNCRTRQRARLLLCFSL